MCPAETATRPRRGALRGKVSQPLVHALASAPMVSSSTRQVGARACATLLVATAAALIAGSPLGCDGGKDSTTKDTEKSPSSPTEAQPRLPTLEFPAEIRAPHPEVSAFLDEFLNTCLVGDYAGYRRLVSRAYAPESRERFETIYQATDAVTVESIERIASSRTPGDVYRVVITVEFNPQHQINLRETQLKVAILVFKEGENWRMAPAPAELQPHDEPPPAMTSAPTTSAPTYPWDEDGDY